MDYLSYFTAFLIYVFLYKTVRGFRTLSVGININAANSLGINSLRTQMITVIISGALCGLGGVALSLGQVTLFTENMTAGRGFIAMAAASMARNHPIFCIISLLWSVSSLWSCDTKRGTKSTNHGNTIYGNHNSPCNIWK